MNQEAVYRTAPATPGLLKTKIRALTLSLERRRIKHGFGLKQSYLHKRNMNKKKTN